MTSAEVSLTVNGEAVQLTVEPRELLGDVLRERLGCRGVHLACAEGRCGACTVLLDGQAIRSCLLLAVQAHGRAVDTITAVASDAAGRRLLEAMHETGAVQCGYCTAGVVLAVLSYLDEDPTPGPEAIREALAGHICRCTGYASIIQAVERYAREQSENLDEEPS